MCLGGVDRSPGLREVESEQLVLEPAVLGECEVLDDAADAQIRRRQRSGVKVVVRQVSCLGEDGATFLVESFRETDPFRCERSLRTAFHAH